MSKQVLNQTYAATTPIASSLAADATAARGAIMLRATTAGTVQPQYVDEDGTAIDLPEGSYAVSANLLCVIQVPYPIRRLQVVFTPASQPGSVKADIHLM